MVTKCYTTVKFGESLAKCDGSTRYLCKILCWKFSQVFSDPNMCNSHIPLQLSNRQCSSGCKSTVNCCLTSQPCLNGGACVPIQDNQRRFRCKCAPGYKGKRCATRQCDSGYTGANCETPIMSCHGYAEGERKTGNHKVVNMYTNQSYDVYCYFNTTSSMTWTLLQSYQKSQAQIMEFPFTISKPMAEDTPSNVSYRLSRQRMESIQQDSSYWGISCSSNDKLDYIMVSRNKLDILTYEGEACIEVLSVAVGDQTCTTQDGVVCTVCLKQDTTEPIHSIYYHPDNKNLCNCTFVILPNNKAYCSSAGRKRANYFGFSKCINPDHQCSTSENSTIQTWFGG